MSWAMFERGPDAPPRYTPPLFHRVMEHSMTIGLTTLALLTIIAIDAVRKCHVHGPERRDLNWMMPLEHFRVTRLSGAIDTKDLLSH
jgi:hypothetical protein